MKHILLICGLLLCIANSGYSQNPGAALPAPPRRDILSPSPSRPVGIDINHPRVLVWFTRQTGNVVVKVTNSAGATISKSIYADKGTSLTIDVSALGQTYYTVYVTNKLGIVIAKL